MLTQLSVEEFLSRTASSDPVPGGGSISALAAAAAAALAQMVAGLTVGRSKFASVEQAMRDLRSRAVELQEKLTADVDRDSAAYGQVLEAFRLPRQTEAQRLARGQAIQEAFKQAARVPMEVAAISLEVIRLAGQAMEKGNPNATTDAAVSVMMARTAALGAVLNVKINLESVKDEDFVSRMQDQAAAIKDKVLELEKTYLEKTGL